MADCTGSDSCEAEVHVHGCWRDYGSCDDPWHTARCWGQDDGTWPCARDAVMECWTIHGRWEPMCQRHAEGYRLNDRARPLGGCDDREGKYSP